MNSRQAKKLFEKYLDGKCTKEELKLLDAFLESYQNRNSANKRSKKDNIHIAPQVWEKIKLQISVENTRKRYFQLKKYMKYAAVFIGVAICGLLVYYNTASSLSESRLLIEDEAVVIKIGHNKEVKVDQDDQQLLTDSYGKVIGKQNGSQLDYRSSESRALIYNEIEVPRGKRFQLILSDGTQVHLNAGTSMRYPVSFLPGHTREVFLKGEAYFEVTKNEQDPFIVNTQNMDVTVLGTHFNVNSYDDFSSFTVLVEGSVSISKDNDEGNGVVKVIVPGEKASVEQATIAVEPVDISNYIDWLTGKLTFVDMPFREIVKKIEIKYNVSIKNEYAELNEARFKGRFEDETIIDLMDVFKESVGFEYQIIDNQIVINRP